MIPNFTRSRRLRTLFILTSFFMLSCVLTPAYAAQGSVAADPSAVPPGARIVEVLLGEEKVDFDVPPFIEGDRTLVPVRRIMECLGGEVDWDPDSRVVTMMRAGSVIILTVDSRLAFVDGQEVELDVPARIVGNRTVVPLRFVSENFGAQLDWDPVLYRVTVHTEAQPVIPDTPSGDAPSSGAPSPTPPPTGQQPPPVASRPTFSVTLPSEPVRLGEQFEVPVMLHGATDVYALQVYLTFDVSKLEAVSVRAGDFVSGFVAKREYSNTEGTVWFAVTKLGQVPGSSGDGKTLTVTFRPKSTGSTVIVIDPVNTQLLNTQIQYIQFDSADAHLSIAP